MTLLAVVVGLVLGSFANVCIHRLPRRESVTLGRSRCPRCGAQIWARDNVPVVSYLLLRGRCRDCGGPISLRYPVVEVAAAILTVVLLRRFGLTVDGIAYAFLGITLMVVFAIDLEHHIIPNAITYPGIAAGLVVAAAAGRGVNALLAAAGASGLMLLIALLSRGGMGGGDVKLAAMLGAFLGWPLIAVALLLAFFAGAGVGVLLIALGRRSRKDVLPFGPAMAAGAVAALLWGAPLLHWYLSLR
ncbi:MAG: prepilin peptidase [Armatimonadetes bacterium]|nr:prepilin peptidase [Armatimonadota bacterium]